MERGTEVPTLWSHRGIPRPRPQVALQPLASGVKNCDWSLRQFLLLFEEVCYWTSSIFRTDSFHIVRMLDSYPARFPTQFRRVWAFCCPCLQTLSFSTSETGLPYSQKLLFPSSSYLSQHSFDPSRLSSRFVLLEIKFLCSIGVFYPYDEPMARI